MPGCVFYWRRENAKAWTSESIFLCGGGGTFETGGIGVAVSDESGQLRVWLFSALFNVTEMRRPRRFLMLTAGGWTAHARDRDGSSSRLSAPPTRPRRRRSINPRLLRWLQVALSVGVQLRRSWLLAVKRRQQTRTCPSVTLTASNRAAKNFELLPVLTDWKTRAVRLFDGHTSSGWRRLTRSRTVALPCMSEVAIIVAVVGNR